MNYDGDYLTIVLRPMQALAYSVPLHEFARGRRKFWPEHRQCQNQCIVSGQLLLLCLLNWTQGTSDTPYGSLAV